jgi:hypothetical protein
MISTALQALLTLSVVVGKVDPDFFFPDSPLSMSRIVVVNIFVTEPDFFGSYTSGISVKIEYAKSTNFVLTLHVNF